MQADIDNLVLWSNTWKMSFNEDKCKVMFFDKRKNNQLNEAFSCDQYISDDLNSDSDPQFIHQRFTMTDPSNNTHILGETTTERDLGILVDNRLKWSDQIGYAKSKAYNALGNLKRTFIYWTPLTFKILFTTFVRPHLEFCASVWSPHTEYDIASLESVQRNATKLVPTIRSLKYEKRLEALDLTTLAHRRIRGDIIQFTSYKGINSVSWVKPIRS